MWKYDPAKPDEYLGNIWGWRFSAFGAALLLGLIGLAYGVARSRGLTLLEAVRETPAPVIGILPPRAPAVDTTAALRKSQPQDRERSPR